MFAVWLDDETLQKQEVYLPSLPKQYDAHKLAKIMQRQQVGLPLHSTHRTRDSCLLVTLPTGEIVIHYCMCVFTVNMRDIIFLLK